MTKLKVEHLKKSFGDLEVLKDLNAEVEEGEVICIIGPSGSGKSTFLRCLNNLEEITGGKVIIDDRDLTDPSQNINKIRENIGMVFQHFNLFPHLTVIENIMLAPKELKDESDEEIRNRALSLLETVGLAEKADDYPKSLSGGQKQRVAIARAIVNEPSVLMADEPTGNLDSKTTLEIMRIFQEINNEWTTVVMVTHEPEVAEYTKRIVLFKDGEIQNDHLQEQKLV